MRVDVITLFPGMFAGPLSESIIGRATEKGIISVNLIDLREFCEGRHRQADDAPYGGGPGMVLMAEPIFKAVESLSPHNSLKRIILTSARGSLFDQKRPVSLHRKKISQLFAAVTKASMNGWQQGWPPRNCQ